LLWGVLTRFLKVITKLRAHFYVPAIPTKKNKLEFADIDEVCVFIFMHLVVRAFSCGVLGNVEPIFWPSPVRIGPFLNFNVSHPAIGSWRSSIVAGKGNSR
jgi:hypothetical protein